jgi:hypothetical protein
VQEVVERHRGHPGCVRYTCERRRERIGRDLFAPHDGVTTRAIRARDCQTSLRLARLLRLRNRAKREQCNYGCQQEMHAILQTASVDKLYALGFLWI